MDIILLAASASLAAYLPRQIALSSDSTEETTCGVGNNINDNSASSSKNGTKKQLHGQRSPLISIAVGLGLGFFTVSLSILEAVPSSYLLLFDNDSVFSGILNHNGHITLSSALKLLLWSLCVWIVIVVPTAVASTLIEKIFSIIRSAKGINSMYEDDEDQKKKKFNRGTLISSLLPWWIEYGFLLLLTFIYRVLVGPSIRFVRKQFRHHSRKSSDVEGLPVVQTCSSDDSVATSSGGGGGGGNSGRAFNNSMMTSASRKRRQKSLVMGSIVGVTSTIVILRILGPFVIESQSDGILTTIVSWLCAIGLLLSSILNGFGSVSMPYTCLSGAMMEPIRADLIVQAEEDLRKMTFSLESKRLEYFGPTLAVSVSTISSTSSSNSRKRSSSINKYNYVSQDMPERKTLLQDEIEFLDILCDELQEEVADLKYMQRTAQLARTPVGRIKTIVGVVFSIILLLRLCMALISVSRFYRVGAEMPKNNTASRSNQRDPITIGLLFLMGHNVVTTQEDYATLSQCISLLLTAILSFTQVRTFLRIVTALNRRLMKFYRKCYCTKQSLTSSLQKQDHQGKTTASTSNVLSDVYCHLLGSMIGCYFLSCVVLIKMNVPKEYKSSFMNALNGMNFRVNTGVTNCVFAFSALLSTVILSLIFGIRRQQSAIRCDNHSSNNIDCQGSMKGSNSKDNLQSSMGKHDVC